MPGYTELMNELKRPFRGVASHNWSFATEKQEAVDLNSLIGKFIDRNCIHYLVNGKLHREDGPAIIYPDGRKEWCLDGKHYDSFSDMTGDVQWAFLKGNIENIEIIGYPTIEMQRYVLDQNPYLISKIQNLAPSVRKQYSDILLTKSLGI